MQRGDAVAYLVRPFDRRLLVLGDDADDRRQALARRFPPPGLGLVLSAGQRVQAGVFLTDRLTDARVLSSHGSCRILPLHAAPGKAAADRLADAYGFPPTPEQVLVYLYAILWSPSYRRRFTGCGRHELPRVPWPRDGVAFPLVEHEEMVMTAPLLPDPA